MYFHVIRQADGTGGQSYSNVTEAYNILNNDFNPQRIFFIWDGIVDYIDDLALYNLANPNVFLLNNHIDGIDIYLFPDSNNDPKGLANGVGVSSELYVSGTYWRSPHPSLITSHVVSHEMGHVLNLFHTHHGTFVGERGPYDCAEFVNGSNSLSCGDYIEDTPADPNLNFDVNPISYSWNGSGVDGNGDFYKPDTKLIMSYTDIRCMEYFTPMQGKVMRTAINDLTFLQSTIIAAMNPSLTGNTTICDSATYNIIGIPVGLSVSWNCDNSNFTITPSGNQCLVRYTGMPRYRVANLTATVSWNGITLKTLSKRIVMHGVGMLVNGQQDGYVSSNGIFPDRQFTIPANGGLRGTIEWPDRDEIANKDSHPIVFIEDDSRNSIHPPVDWCGYGITEINGGNMVYLSSTRFDGMDISFSGITSPTYFYHNGNNVAFMVPYNATDYSLTLDAHSNSGCYDFCLTFNVIPLPGAGSGDDEIWVNLCNPMLYVTFMCVGDPIGNGQYYMPPYNVTISKIPSGTQMYSNTFSGNQSSFSVNIGSWASGIYSIRIVQNGHVYSKSIYL